MKIIISHDVDHLFVSEHFGDLIIPKFLVRSKIELFMGKISLFEYFSRISDIIKNKFNCIDEIIEFDKLNGIPSTFFVGVSNGLGLNYPVKNAEVIIRKIISSGFDVGVHGIAFDDFEGIKKEFETFAGITGNRKFGIRMHYLRHNHETLKLLEEAGYLFDATIPQLKPVFELNKITEFPVHIMDGWVINKNKSWQVNNLKKALDESKRLIDEGLKNNVDCFSILFHDRYFSNSFKTWKNWYVRLIEYLKNEGFQFVDYRMAIKERINIKTNNYLN